MAIESEREPIRCQYVHILESCLRLNDQAKCDSCTERNGSLNCDAITVILYKWDAEFNQFRESGRSWDLLVWPNQNLGELILTMMRVIQKWMPSIEQTCMALTHYRLWTEQTIDFNSQKYITVWIELILERKSTLVEATWNRINERCQSMNDLFGTSHTPRRMAGAEKAR